MSTKQYFIVVLITVLSILGAFYSGFFLKDILNPKSNNTTPDNSQLFKPNFIDEVIITTTEKPHKTIILSAIRTFVDKNTVNYTIKAFFFDGEKWTKDIEEGRSKILEGIPNTLIVPSWVVTDDPSYMLRQSVVGKVNLNNKKIEFDIPLFSNEIGIRSSYKYTKFMSEADAKITIDGQDYKSKAVYSRVYSFNPPESLVFTSDPAGIETEWLAFWDKEGNFYSIDETTIDNKKTLETYKAHSLGIVKDKDGGIQKSFILDLKETSEQNYSVEIKDNINKTISIEKLNSTNKSVNGKDIWITGLVEGTIKTVGGKIISGFGIYEQISQ